MAPRRGRPGRPRRAATRDAVRKDILLFVEGKRTEEDYLVHWHRVHRRQVNVHIDPFRGGPRQLIDRAAQAKRRSEREARRREGRAYDEVWCMFDIDEHPSLHEVRTMAADNGINLAVSSPCLELWFLLHYADQTAHIDRHDAQRRSADLLQCEKALTHDALESTERSFIPTPATERARSTANTPGMDHRPGRIQAVVSGGLSTASATLKCRPCARASCVGHLRAPAARLSTA